MERGWSRGVRLDGRLRSLFARATLPRLAPSLVYAASRRDSFIFEGAFPPACHGPCRARRFTHRPGMVPNILARATTMSGVTDTWSLTLQVFRSGLRVAALILLHVASCTPRKETPRWAGEAARSSPRQPGRGDPAQAGMAPIRAYAPAPRFSRAHCTLLGSQSS